MTGLRILYLDSHTRPDGHSHASDEVGYGITSSAAIKAEFRRRGCQVHDHANAGKAAANKGEFIERSYQLLWDEDLNRYDAIFIFHSFHQFPSEVRRILLDRGFHRLRLFGYTHGSHWDTTDTFRTEHYPGMAVTDLANLLAMDRVFVVSHYLREVILRNVATFSSAASAALAEKLRVAGLPINCDLIERYRRPKSERQLRIVFNHSATSGKSPARFFRLMRPILAEHPVALTVTRAFATDSPGAQELDELMDSNPGRVRLGNTMPLQEYYSSLWESHIQISTANHESLGIATLEAMYTQNCCLLPERLSYPELTGGVGLYGSDEDLLSKLRSFLRDGDARQRAGAILRERSRHYHPEAVVARLLAGMEEAFAT